MDFAFPADHRIKVLDGKKVGKYVDFARELQRWNIKMTVIPNIVEALCQGTKKETWLKGDERKNYYYQLEYREESWRPEETYCHSDSSENPPTNIWYKKTCKKRNNNNNWR